MHDWLALVRSVYAVCIAALRDCLSLHLHEFEAWKAYADRMKITSRNVSSYQEEFAKWLEQAEFKEKYTSNSFKAARARRKKLVGCQLLKYWEEFFRSSTGFLHADLQSGHDRTLLNLNLNRLATFLGQLQRSA